MSQVTTNHKNTYSDPLLSVQKQMHDLLEGWLRHKSDMVNYEAARAICEMRNVTSTQLTRAVNGEIVRFVESRAH